MAIIKNPFRSKAVPNGQPTHTASPEDPLSPPPNIGARVESPRQSVSITRPAEPEYKLSSVSPEGTFMPPSPPEKTSFLSRFKNSGSTSNARATVTTKKEDDTGFLIPRESLDGYRRSFDIRPSMDGSGQYNDGRPSRSSLDLLSATLGGSSPRRPSHTSMQPLTTRNNETTKGLKPGNSVAPPLRKENSSNLENEFEEVKLDDSADNTAVRKKHFWSRSSDLSFGLKKQREDENELRPISKHSDNRETGATIASSNEDAGHGELASQHAHTSKNTRDEHVIPSGIVQAAR
ncbi:protein of unknown function [Taphrina deformans PYCC 5710]|uniref:Uncharacterized protein n=1 Tax=Taphrina deformans (strain PYCC 5710 / ATCC 11124 / CBS 356.35 / IMI 108563 / JCM 9778 / NBRC 8474) TaxID=1097556 RepID=R4XHU3_TAPDE|nr:protein of unknown function [Taphrina deformans PYCC 5710]|eukprot:CCG84083.1 protein of unknown function [Taphrina deformans PYCC 5710]